MNGLLAHSEQVGFATFGTDWLYLLVPVALLIGIVVLLIATGVRPPGTGIVATPFVRAGSSLERITGLPAWSSGGIGLGLWALVVAVIGFLWDVAWHMDLGRDEFIFTPSHMMILIGLLFIALAAVLSVVFATISGAETGFRFRHLRIPYSALPLGLLGIGALTGFPLDELWHQNYGVDVTMWGPTHLLMISGASFTPLALWLMLREAGPDAGRSRLVRDQRFLFAGAVAVGFSTFQAEFDFGTPQFQQLYHPVLIAIATGISLTAARVALGRGGALIAAGGFIAVRALLAGLIGPVLNHTVPRFPLYLGAAVMVEVAALLGRNLRPLQFGALAGALAGSIGVAFEWGWMQFWGRHPWGANLFPGVLIALAAAVAAGVLGVAIGRVLAFETPGIRTRPLMLAGIVLVGSLIVPLPRNSEPHSATLRTREVGERRVALEVEVEPSLAQRETDWFEVLSWQGGSVEITQLRRTGPGHLSAERPVPVGSNWKTLVRIADKDTLMAVPVYMPADPEMGLSEIPLEPVKSEPFRRDTELLMREAHEGAAWPSLIAYGSILFLVVCWIGAFTIAFSRLAARPDVHDRTRASPHMAPRPVKA